MSQDPTLLCLPPQQKQGIFLSRASSISLTVEHALESFSFLNTSDMEDSEGSEEEPFQDERCTAGLMGWGAGQDVALWQLEWGVPSSAQVHLDRPITAQGRSRTRSSRIWPFWWHSATLHLSRGGFMPCAPGTGAPSPSPAAVIL